MKLKLKFFERVALRSMKEFQKLDTEDKKRYITLFGHSYFSLWLISLVFRPVIVIFLCVMGIIFASLNIIVVLFAENILFLYMNLFISFPFIVWFLCTVRHITKVWKMDVKQIKEWIEISADKIQNFFFKDFKVFSVWKRMYVRKKDKAFYNFLLRDTCRGRCYECTFKLAKMWKDPKVKILWIAAMDISEGVRYGHAVIKRNDFILDTNTRKSYKANTYLNAQQTEIFYEYSLEEYLQVDSPWELKWQEFGKWCESRNVQRDK